MWSIKLKHLIRQNGKIREIFYSTQFQYNETPINELPGMIYLLKQLVAKLSEEWYL